MTRRAAVTKLQIARRELGLEEDDYRALLQRVTGRRSATELDDRQIGRVLDVLKGQGWPDKRNMGQRRAGDRPRPAASPVARKARALWISLHQLGVVRDPSERALEAFARRQLGVERLNWARASDGHRLIEALKAMAERAGWRQDTPGLTDPEAIAVTLKMRLEALIDAKSQGSRAPE